MGLYTWPFLPPSEPAAEKRGESLQHYTCHSWSLWLGQKNAIIESWWEIREDQDSWITTILVPSELSPSAIRSLHVPAWNLTENAPDNLFPLGRVMRTHQWLLGHPRSSEFLISVFMVLWFYFYELHKVVLYDKHTNILNKRTSKTNYCISYWITIYFWIN